MHFEIKTWKTIYFLVEITVFNRSLRSLKAEDKLSTIITHLEHIYLVMLMIIRYIYIYGRWSMAFQMLSLKSNKTWNYRIYNCLSITRPPYIKYVHVSFSFASRIGPYWPLKWNENALVILTRAQLLSVSKWFCVLFNHIIITGIISTQFDLLPLFINVKWCVFGRLMAHWEPSRTIGSYWERVMIACHRSTFGWYI